MRRFNPGTSEGGAAAPQAARSVSAHGDYPYAGFWRRFGGLAIDYLVLILGYFLIWYMSIMVDRLFRQGLPRTGIGKVELACSAFSWLYFAGMESFALQATLGKLALGVKVTDLQGQRVSFLRATGRYFAHIVTALTLGIGYAMVVFTRKRQALHDMIAGTLVVKRRFSQEEVATIGPAPDVSGWATAGAICGVLFFGPFGIGVLAAIAIPAYTDYTIRAKVAEGLNEATPYKVAVSEAFERGQPLGAVTTETLGLAPHEGSRFVQSIDVASGVVVVTYSNQTPQISGQTVLLIPGTSGDGRQLDWFCGRRRPPEGTTLARPDLDLSSYTTVLDRYLPVVCKAQ